MRQLADICCVGCCRLPSRPPRCWSAPHPPANPLHSLHALCVPEPHYSDSHCLPHISVNDGDSVIFISLSLSNIISGIWPLVIHFHLFHNTSLALFVVAITHDWEFVQAFSIIACYAKAPVERWNIVVSITEHSFENQRGISQYIVARWFLLVFALEMFY